MADTLKPLAALAVGDRAIVARVALPTHQQPRLLEMGLLVGTPIQLIRFAPLGDPVEIKIRGYHLTLRKADAEQIWVSPHEP